MRSRMRRGGRRGARPGPPGAPRRGRRWMWGGGGARRVPAVALAVAGGRQLRVPKSLKGVAVFSFKRLCGEARGAADYLAIAQRCHTVIVVGIPVMTKAMRNEAARFVTLIDALYEHRVKLLAAADAEPSGPYPGGDGSFEVARTASAR